MFNKQMLKAQMVLKGFSGEKIAKELQINPSTFYRKMNDDGDFSRSEIVKICEILDIKEPNEIFFG